MYALATPSEWKAHQAGYRSVQTTQSESRYRYGIYPAVLFKALTHHGNRPVDVQCRAPSPPVSNDEFRQT